MISHVRQNRLDSAMSRAYTAVSAWTHSTMPRDKYAPFITPVNLASAVLAAFGVISGLFETYKMFSARRRAVKKDGTPNTGINRKHNVTGDVTRVLNAWLAGDIPAECIDDATLFGISIEMVRISFNEMYAFDVSTSRSENLRNDALNHNHKTASLDFDGRDGDLPETHSADNYANSMMAEAYTRVAHGSCDIRNPLDIVMEREESINASDADAYDAPDEGRFNTFLEWCER